jgi:hypothetical protein
VCKAVNSAFSITRSHQRPAKSYLAVCTRRSV